MFAVVLAGALCVALIASLLHKWEDVRVRRWIREQVAVASFSYAGDTTTEERLRLRAGQNRRLKAAFGIENSLTTERLSTHRTFLRAARRLLNRESRDWQELYCVAEAFLESELAAGRHRLRLAQTTRCLVLAIVLFDNFGLTPDGIPRTRLVTITDEINKQWLRSKCHPDDVRPSQELNAAIDSLGIRSSDIFTLMTAQEVLGMLMPQYETLWRVVLLAFVTAYHLQPLAHADAVQRTADLPACLGDPHREKEALKLAKESLRLFPSNKHLYRSSLVSPGTAPHGPPPAISADISALHRHSGIWGRDALAFRPSRFDDGALTAAQRGAYLPFSVGRHRCPAADTSGEAPAGSAAGTANRGGSNSGFGGRNGSGGGGVSGGGGANGFGERMVTLLVVVLGRVLGPERGVVDLGGGPCAEVGVAELPTGRDQMDGWVWEARRADERVTDSNLS